jgi:hypothetical protein
LDRGSALRIAEELNMQNMAVPLLLVVRNNSELPLHNIFMNVVIRPSSAVKTVSDRLESLGNTLFLSWTSNLLKNLKLEETTLARISHRR